MGNPDDSSQSPGPWDYSEAVIKTENRSETALETPSEFVTFP